MVRKKKAQQLVLPKMHAALHCKAKIIIKSGFSGIIGAEQPPDLNNLKAAFYGFKDDRKAGDIDKSTTLCVKAICDLISVSLGVCSRIEPPTRLVGDFFYW